MKKQKKHKKHKKRKNKKKLNKRMSRVDVEALYKRGMSLYLEKDDGLSALKYLLKAAQNGYKPAYSVVGILLYRYKGDATGGEKWFKKAEKVKCLDDAAVYEYAMMFYFEKDDPEKALKYLHLAADNGYEPAYGDIGFLLYAEKADAENAKTWFERADKANCLNERAAYEYGAMYYYEKYDVENALKYLYMAADDGNELAYGELGIIFYRDKEDVDTAEKWFEKAEKEGDLLAPAAQAYGLLLYKERGNIEKALKYQYYAANRGFDLAYPDLGEILYKEKRDIEGAKKWFKKAEEADLVWLDQTWDFGMFLIEEMGEKELGEHYLKVASEKGY